MLPVRLDIDATQCERFQLADSKITAQPAGMESGSFQQFSMRSRQRGLLSRNEQRSLGKRPLLTSRKIKIIKELTAEAGFIEVGEIFDDFYNNHLRNAVGHSDYILADDDFRCRGDTTSTKAFRISYGALDEIITSAKAFISAFFQVELFTRQVWGAEKHKAVPYDPQYKGLMEILVDERDVMCGFRVHWPNGSESTYPNRGRD